MNWNRKELKLKARYAIPKNYWKTFFVTTLFFYLCNGTILGNASNSISRLSSVIHTFKSENIQHKKEVFALISVAGVCLIAFNIVVKLVMDVFLTNPLRIGAGRFMIKNLQEDEKGEIKDLAMTFDSRYLQGIKAMFLRDLLVMAGLLLLIFPGIYLLYCYRCVPYLLSTDRNYTAKEILQKSRQMMNGQKKAAFLLDLSFIPLHLLGTITIGLAELFYVKPYVTLTNAALFLEIYNDDNNNDLKQEEK